MRETEKAINDFTRVIERLPGALVEDLAKALINRGITRSMHGEEKKAIGDYTQVIEFLPDAPVDQVAKARGKRALILAKLDEEAKQTASDHA